MTLLALLSRVEVFDVGMILHKGGMPHACRNDERQAHCHQCEQPYGTRCLRGFGGYSQYIASGLDQAQQRRPQNEAAHAQRDAPGKAGALLIVAAKVHRRRAGWWNVLGFSAGKIAANQLIQGAGEDLAELQELVHLGRRLAGLPLGHRLPRNPQQHGQLLLGHGSAHAQVGEVGTKAHNVPFRGWTSSAHASGLGCAQAIWGRTLASLCRCKGAHSTNRRLHF